LCPIEYLFHIPCPGCGLTRAAIHLLHGELSAAISANILSVPIFILLLLIVIKKEKFIDFCTGNIRVNKTVYIYIASVCIAASWGYNLLYNPLFH
jgi:hypothetical protein